MDDLIKRLQHFEYHKSRAGDSYGAEVLHHAWQAITRLQSIVEKADELAKAVRVLVDDWEDSLETTVSSTLTPMGIDVRDALRAYEAAKGDGGA